MSAFDFVPGPPVVHSTVLPSSLSTAQAPDHPDTKVPSPVARPKDQDISIDPKTPSSQLAVPIYPADNQAMTANPTNMIVGDLAVALKTTSGSTPDLKSSLVVASGGSTAPPESAEPQIPFSCYKASIGVSLYCRRTDLHSRPIWNRCCRDY